MARLIRPTFRRKTGLRLSKSEAALEHGFKEKDVFTLTTLTGATTLDYVPDVIVASSAITGACTVNLAVPAASAQAFNRVVQVVNQDPTFTVSLAVAGGVAATPVGPGQSRTYYIADASANTTPVTLELPSATAKVRNFLAAAADYAMTADDGIETVVVADAIEITLPVAAANMGRKIQFMQLGTAVLTVGQNADGANIAGADNDYVALDAANDRAELLCNGTEWLITHSTIA